MSITADIWNFGEMLVYAGFGDRLFRGSNANRRMLKAKIPSAFRGLPREPA
jgi:hypothetical protein